MRKAVVVLTILAGLLIAGNVLALDEQGGGEAGMSFESTDEDGDGLVGWEEYSRRSTETDMERMMRDFQRLDRDSDGMISEEEWEGGQKR